MSAAIALRSHIHRGSVLASGVVVDTRLIGADAAEQRVLGLLEGGIEVRRFEHFFVARFREPLRIECASAVGAPVVRYETVHSTAPLERDEVARFECGDEIVVTVEGGVGRALRFSEAAPVDVSSWVDLSAFEVPASEVSLGDVAPPPTRQLVEASSDVRGPLGVERLAPAGAALMSALSAPGGAPESPGRSTRASGLAGLLGALGALGALVFSFLGRPRIGARAPGAPSDARVLVAMPAPPDDGLPWLARLRRLLQHAAALALVGSRLAPLVGRRHAKYLARMLQMFDDEDFDEALRHAIPLSGEVAAAFKPVPLRTPSPRTDLAIVPAHADASSSLALGGGAFATLELTYRRAFDRLVERGEVEKAAFVLAELLNANEEAVSFLERQGRLELAAEIAEARQLPPGLVVRQWFLAGDKERAVRIARQTGAFADAVTRLERTHESEGNALRLMWADALADAGAYAAAVDAAWPVREARGLALGWVDRAIAVGGPTGARMLVKKLRACPDAFPDVRDRVLALLDDEAQERGTTLALAAEVLAGEPTDGTRVLAKRTVRALLAAAHDDETDRLVRALLDASGDAALRADVSACRTATGAKPAARPVVRVVAFALTDIGKQRVHDEDVCLATFLADPSAFLADPSASSMRTAMAGEASRKGVLLAAIDGAGGHGCGDFAAKLARGVTFDTLQKAFVTHGVTVDEWANCLATAVEHANREIVRQAATHPARRGAGCALTIATLAGGTLLVAQVGDTRAYLLREGRLVRITTDHSLLNDYIAAGKVLTPKEIEDFPHKNIITRALGLADDVRADLVRVELRHKDVLLLCSDGLHGVVDDALVRDAIMEHEPRAACEALVSLALDAGGPDNISVVVARFEGPGLPPAARAPVRPEAVGPRGREGGRAAGEASLASRATPLVVHRARADAGAVPVLDAAALPDGRLLVALGEIGAWLLARDGKVLVRFTEPAHRLVLSDHGDRAILVAPRGDVRPLLGDSWSGPIPSPFRDGREGYVRLARLDLMTKRVRTWCDARVDAYASDFDGSTWLVASGHTVFAIDAASPAWEHVWAAPLRAPKEARIERRVARNASTFSAVRESPFATTAEIWSYEAGSHTLRRRAEVTDAVDVSSVISANGLVAAWRPRGAEGGGATASVFVAGAWKDLPLTTEVSARDPRHLPSMNDEWVAFPVVVTEGTVVHLFDMKSLRQRATFRLDGVFVAPALRFQGDRLVVSDTCGRVLVVSLQTGDVLREVRVS